MTGVRTPDFRSAFRTPDKSRSENPIRTSGFVRYGATLEKFSIADFLSPFDA